MQITPKEHDEIIKEIRRDTAKVKRSKKAARRFLLALGLITPTGRISKAKPRLIPKNFKL